MQRTSERYAFVQGIRYCEAPSMTEKDSCGEDSQAYLGTRLGSTNTAGGFALGARERLSVRFDVTLGAAIVDPS
jgi:hypothetical protein